LATVVSAFADGEKSGPASSGIWMIQIVEDRAIMARSGPGRINVYIFGKRDLLIFQV